MVLILGFAASSYASIADEIFKAALNYGKDYAKNKVVMKGIESAAKKVDLKGGYTLAKGYFVWKSGDKKVAKQVVRNFWHANAKKRHYKTIRKVCDLNSKIRKYTHLGTGEVSKFIAFVHTSKQKYYKYIGKSKGARKR